MNLFSVKKLNKRAYYYNLVFLSFSLLHLQVYYLLITVGTSISSSIKISTFALVITLLKQTNTAVIQTIIQQLFAPYVCQPASI